MINNPPVNELQGKVGTRYMLVTVVAKRARQLVLDPERIGNLKPVSVAVDELYDNKLNIKFPEEYTAR
ncbi:MAG: DNA-directed RNA polymerase subunit omega [Eubacteriales bacterium]|nr:DNA-directed RNA polymerase subunit omega [Eubacteriales bacterium]